jgi:hypothetical protein
MTIPVPVSTDPAADAALHIRSFAEAVDGRLVTPLNVRTFDTGEKLTDANGLISIARPSSMSSVTGAVFSYVELIDNSSHRPAGAPYYDNMYAPVGIRDTGQPSVIAIRSQNGPNGATFAGRYVRYVGLVWGPVAAAADEPAPQALPPGSTFPPGQTARGIRYPGTDGEQWATAQAISTMADDVGAAIGGSPLGLALYTWTGTQTTTAAGYLTIPFAGKLSNVKGMVALARDTSGSNKQTRTFGLNQHPLNNPLSSAWVLVTTNTADPAVGADYALRVKNQSVSLHMIAWGTA